MTEMTPEDAYFILNTSIEGSREVNRAIHLLVTGEDSPGHHYDVPYSTSLDMACSLIPDLAFIWEFRTINEGIVGGFAWLYGPSSPWHSDVQCWGRYLSTVDHRKSLSLAVVTAALDARKNIETETPIPYDQVNAAGGLTYWPRVIEPE